MLPWNVDAATLSDALEALSSIHTATVDSPPTGGPNGGFTWRVTLTSVEQDGVELAGSDRLQTNDQALLYAEGYLLVGSNAKISVTPVCPTAATASGAFSSQRGQLGHTFVPVLTGADDVTADVTYQGPGTYIATYETPRAATYSLEVRHARPRGLQAAYFSNRWLYGSPDVERVDPRLDFDWPSLITPSSQDFVSARWTGYVKPAFSEDYVFYVRVNDGARLWIQDTLVLDAFENEVPTGGGVKTMEFASNATTLVAGRLTPIVLEYRELTGYAALTLLWASRSQDKSVVPSERLFYRSTPIFSSPFGVETFGVKPTPPTAVQLSIAAWDALTVAFNAPVDDGGAAVDRFLVEWWTTGTYGTPEVQVVKLGNGNTGGSFTLELDNGAITGPLAWNALPSDVEAALEALDGAGDVSVSSSTASGVSRDYTITFATRVGVVPTLRVNGAKLTGTGVFGVCSKASATPTGNPGAVVTCLAAESVVSTVNILGSSTQVSLDVRLGDPYRFTIRGLVQAAATAAPSAPGLGGPGGPGFDVRVTAHTAAGYGRPSAPVSLKPMAVPCGAAERRASARRRVVLEPARGVGRASDGQQRAGHALRRRVGPVAGPDARGALVAGVSCSAALELPGDRGVLPQRVPDVAAVQAHDHGTRAGAGVRRDRACGQHHGRRPRRAHGAVARGAAQQGDAAGRRHRRRLAQCAPRGRERGRLGRHVGVDAAACMARAVERQRRRGLTLRRRVVLGA
ncbi:hypothetical protein PINS_up012351 [Pythium insidiosum]|nr:hypothetical protein PINS_up012351 [Pythium insidiosum]